MESIEEIFQIDSDIVATCYTTMPNYLIFEDELSNSNDCILYFSSNSIYYPNEKSIFKEEIDTKNRFEWFGSRIKGKKHIFLRDIKKQWYLSGINSELNAPWVLLEFLKKETKGYNIITMGSSSGGYAAVLFGSLLNASKIICFNGQFELFSLLDTSTENIDPLVFRYCNTDEYKKYYDLKNFVYNEGDRIFYFYSNKSKWDIAQYEHIKDLKINIIAFQNSHHGIPFLKSNLKKVLSYDVEKLKELSNKKHNPIYFSVQVIGFKATVFSLYIQAVQLLRKRLAFNK